MKKFTVSLAVLETKPKKMTECQLQLNEKKQRGFRNSPEVQKTEGSVISTSAKDAYSKWAGQSMKSDAFTLHIFRRVFSTPNLLVPNNWMKAECALDY